jgi:alkaline phosphatase D
MPRRAVLASAVALAAGLATAVAVAAPSPRGFAYGVAAGEMTATSVRLWTGAPKAGPVTLVVTGAGATRRFALTASPASDLTVQRTARGLRPGTTYRYRFVQGGVTSVTGRFETAPAVTAAAAVRFAISGDADATPGPNGKPGFNGFETYGAMARARNDFAINFGDTIYSDSEVGGSPVARTVREKWAKYRIGLALEPLRRLRASTGVYSGWDDHEFVNDYSRAEHGVAIYRAGV